MLGKATKTYETLVPKSNDLAKQLFPSSSPAQDGNIQEHFNKGRPSKQSIGGYTGFTNSTNPLQSKSPNTHHNLKRKVPSYASSTSAASTGLQSVFSKQSSFSNAPEMIDLTEREPFKTATLKASQQHVMFDENDFEDDADLDLDIDYDLPFPIAAPSNPAPKAITLMNTGLDSHTKHIQTSSAQTWSSSPAANRRTPPGAIQRREREKTAILQLSQATQISPQKSRPAKRRTLPWPQQCAEDNEAATKERDEKLHLLDGSSLRKVCFRCKRNHDTNDCPTHAKGQGTTWDFTPLHKNKNMPWDTTASAVRNEKQKFKDKQKAARKLDDASVDIIDHHQRDKHKAVLSPIALSEEQKRILNLVVHEQKSVFFTGSAGTGKSVLMRAIIAELHRKYVRDPERVAVTASTGLAACNIGGITLHSFGGIGLGKDDIPTLVKKIKRNPKAKTRWLKTKILIMDEVSMVDGDLFDKLEGIARAIRNNGRPFGGMQLVITGDFFQLPPVPDFEKKERGVKFAFDAGTWPTAIHHTIGLTEVFRQKDPVFANMLNEMRLGKITDDTINAFQKLSRKITYHDSLDATELFPTRNEVENANSFRMRSLPGRSYTYEAIDSGVITDHGMRDKLLSNMMAPKSLELKKGAQVMLIKNMDDGLVNGSLGKVIAFMSEKTFAIRCNDDTLDEDMSSDELSEKSLSHRASMKPSVSSKREFSTIAEKEYPLVRFASTSGPERVMLFTNEEWKVELPNGEVQASRSQVPLILAWALSIHKAQGQTLERVKIDLRKIFEKGQAYVALSRATSQAGLEVQNFNKNKVMAHPRVAEFYNSLYSVNKALQHPKVARPTSLTKMTTLEETKFPPRQQPSRKFDFDEEEAAMMEYG